MKTLQRIIDEADTLVPNVLTTAEKVTQLNAINHDFFNVVKIPKIANFIGVKGQATYLLDSDVRAKNIDYVKAGLLQYRSLDSDQVGFGQNTYSFTDDDHTLALSPAPYRNGLQGIVRYHQVATSDFTDADLTMSPDAPAEYHATYVPALASWIAFTQDDGIKATMFEAQYKAAWNVAAQNHQKG